MQRPTTFNADSWYPLWQFKWQTLPTAIPEHAMSPCTGDRGSWQNCRRHSGTLGNHVPSCWQTIREALDGITTGRSLGHIISQWSFGANPEHFAGCGGDSHTFATLQTTHRTFGTINKKND